MQQAQSGWNKEDVEIVADTFTVRAETCSNRQERIGSRTWIVSARYPAQKAALPIPPFHCEERFPLDRFVVSPNERSLIAHRKVCSGTNAAFLFHRIGGPGSLRYRLADSAPLNQRIAERFNLPPEYRGHDNEIYTDFVLFQLWYPKGRDALLFCQYGPRNGGLYYTVLLDTHTGTFHSYRRTRDKNGLGWPYKTERFSQTRFRLLTPAEIASFSLSNLRDALDEMLARRDFAFGGDKQRAGWLKEGIAYRDTRLLLPDIRAQMWPIERTNFDAMTHRLHDLGGKK